MDSAAAIFTVVVVFPTPPFWLATTKIRPLAGAGIGSFKRRVPTTLLLVDVSRGTLSAELMRKL